MLLFDINPPKKNNIDRLAESSEGKELEQMLFAEMGEQAKQEFKSIAWLTKNYPYDNVLDSIRRSIKSNEPRLPFVKKQLLQILDDLAPKYNFCTGGKTAIEINANGDYGRCSRTVGRKQFMGNLFEDGQVNLLDLNESADCQVNCNRRMCFARNTIRTETRAEFDQQIAANGLRGDYRAIRKDRKSDIFIRWKITETCNYTCSYCTAWKTVNKKLPEMNIDRIIEAAEIFTNQFDRISLRLTGGEPAVKRNYVELMEYFHSRLDRFVEIELRTNFSFPEKQKAVFALDWENKLHYHIGCHVYDKNFRPWDFVDILSKPTSVDYIVKFVATASNKKYVDAFRDYFVKNGVDENTIRIIHDIRDSAEDNSAIPPAIQTMISRGELPEDFFRKAEAINGQHTVTR